MFSIFKKTPIDRFDTVEGENKGKYRFLSNFYPAPLVWRGEKYDTSEHAYQAEKFIMRDPEYAEEIRNAKTAGKAKRLGQRPRPLDEDNKWWDDMKYKRMENIVRAKFKQNWKLRWKLRMTGKRELIEGNTWGDTYWGVCDDVGENHLGKILMKIREEL
ncbi:MAG: NADAR family protein [Desulfobulbia bacterium]